MPTPVQVAVEKYIRVPSEPDPAVRAQLLEECFAENGRLVARRRDIRGRAALADFITQFLSHSDLVGVRMTSAVDAEGTTFRYRSVADFRDGRALEFFDAGEIDADGRIYLILTFAGPLADA